VRDAHRLPEVVIRAEPVTSALSMRLLDAFVAEIGSRLSGGFDPARSVPASPEELSPPTGEFMVLFDEDGSGIGCGGLKSLDRAVLEVKRMWIDPIARGRGLSRVLLSALEDRARELGATELRLDTHASLVAAVALYRAAGYEEIPPYNDNPYASLWFAKQLSVPST
jgi:GNAT superfamily N-acetyltransferase